MAVFNYDEHGSAYRGAYGQRSGVLGEARRWVSIGGAVSSVALVLGLAYWGYALAVRDVTGVPVMRAATGVMRIAPADPGGEQALNQGLTVNAVAALGTSAKSADTIMLAPMSVALQPDDLPVLPVESASPQDASLQDSGLQDTSTQTPAVEPSAISATAVEATAVEPAPILTQDSVDAAVAAALAEGSGTQTASDTSPVLRPMPRPVDGGGATVQADDTAVAASGLLETDANAIPTGAILAQFDAYETEDLARAKFSDLQQRFGGMMAGKSMVVQPVESNGRTIYRLRAYGLTSEDDARNFCAALQSEGTECVPVAQR
jgi:hypothetical protein